MTHKLLDTVVLEKDLPQDGLRSGDLGAVVHVHEPGSMRPIRPSRCEASCATCTHGRIRKRERQLFSLHLANNGYCAKQYP